MSGVYPVRAWRGGRPSRHSRGKEARQMEGSQRIHDLVDKSLGSPPIDSQPCFGADDRVQTGNQQ